MTKINQFRIKKIVEKMNENGNGKKKEKKRAKKKKEKGKNQKEKGKKETFQENYNYLKRTKLFPFEKNIPERFRELNK